MSEIISPILESSFELIRDRIGEILADELTNQALLQPLVKFPKEVWVERFIPFDKEEIPAVNVMTSKGNYDAHTQSSSLGAYTYYIDVYNSAKSSDGARGDALSSKKLQRMVGIIRAILENVKYNTLQFTKPSISHTEVSGFSIAEPDNNGDGTNLIFARLTFEVNSVENTEGIQPIDAEGYSTSVKLAETDKGYKFEINN